MGPILISLALILSQPDTLKWERMAKENDLYRIVVSGYEPKIDTVEIYITPQVTTKYVIPSKRKKRSKRARCKQ